MSAVVKKIKKNSSKSPKVVYFQDYFATKKYIKDSKTHNINIDEAFFELANAPYCGFRLTETCDGKEKFRKSVVIKQDNSCQTHTGGIVWETAYLLALFLIDKFRNKDHSQYSVVVDKEGKTSLGKVLEVGAGCGMLGLILASSGLSTKVFMTETTIVMPNLVSNLKSNVTGATSSCPSDLISARQLRWDEYKKDIKICQLQGSNDLDPHSFDTIIGTDVIFSAKLVKPLLKVFRKMSHERTRIFLCVQVRCCDAYSLFLRKVTDLGFNCFDNSSELENILMCAWGVNLECKILQLSCSRDSSKRRKQEKLVDVKRMKLK